MEMDLFDNGFLAVHDVDAFRGLMYATAAEVVDDILRAVSCRGRSDAGGLAEY